MRRRILFPRDIEQVQRLAADNGQPVAVDPAVLLAIAEVDAGNVTVLASFLGARLRVTTACQDYLWGRATLGGVGVTVPAQALIAEPWLVPGNPWHDSESEFAHSVQAYWEENVQGSTRVDLETALSEIIVAALGLQWLLVSHAASRLRRPHAEPFGLHHLFACITAKAVRNGADLQRMVSHSWSVVLKSHGPTRLRYFCNHTLDTRDEAAFVDYVSGGRIDPF